MIVYVTLFDKNYVDKAVALSNSFAKHCSKDILILGCLDKDSENLLRKLNLVSTSVASVDDFICSTLSKLRGKRTVAEFCWTCKPFLMQHVMQYYPNAEWVVYLDADSLIFGNISTVLYEYNHFDCFFTPHNFHHVFRDLESSVGSYNAGFVAFRNTKNGLQALSEWRYMCESSVSATPNDQGYGDQKYLEELASHWNSVSELVHKGINAAPWNIARYQISKKIDKVMLDDQPLLFFHFQGFKRINRNFNLLYKGTFFLPKKVREYIYSPYCRELQLVDRLFHRTGNDKLINYSGLVSSFREIFIARRNLKVRLDI